MADDAFGVEVARRLAARVLPDDVRVVDFGIRGMDLVYALLDGYETTILVDATQRGGAPGSLYVIEPDLGELDSGRVEFQGHGLDPMAVLAVAKRMGAEFGRMLVVGCEPATLEADDGHIGLSEPVLAAAAEAVTLIESLVEASDSKDILYLMGGVALIALGAGLIMTNSSVRKSVTGVTAAVLPDLQGKIGSRLTDIGPDIQRYLRLRSM
jgi:hydrogenase maturation protease